MIKLNQSQKALLQILSDEKCHSGNELGQALGITRSGIWKQIKQLTDLGFPITSLAHQGYQLPHGFIPLNEQQILEQLLVKQFSTPVNLHLFTSLDSTNRYLKELPITQILDVCCAEIQTHGRGRFGRHWHSPFGENIYCSSRWNLNCDLTRLSGLSLVTSLAVLATLNSTCGLSSASDVNAIEPANKPLNDAGQPSTGIKIKWPNDIFWGDKKLCGSLIEIVAESNGNAQVIIGIGINVNTDTKNQPLPDKPWCSLYEISQQYHNRNLLIANLIINLERYLNKFVNYGLNAFIEEWNTHDYLVGKYITVTQSLGSISGKVSGVNQAGQLILEDNDGQVHFLSSGDTTLQANR